MKWVLASLAVFVALTVTAAHAGSLAPQPRVVATYERDFLGRSGAQTLEELLDTGISRYFLTGGQPALVLVNGRPYATTASELETLPISAIERIEIISGESLGTLGGGAVRGAINVVLRDSLNGFETRALARLPSQDGGDGTQGSVFWGGAVGEGRLTIGVDSLYREQITARSRDYSRSVWQEGGSFSQTQNVSLGGNTVVVVQLDEEGEFAGLRSAALGDCDPANGYTGPLSNPPGIRNGDRGCGFAYGDIMWNSPSYRQHSAFLDLDHPLNEDADLHVDGIFVKSDGVFRYAPSVGTFVFVPDQDLLDAINEGAGETIADANDLFVVGHRFVGHGNRDWKSDFDEYDVAMSVEGRLTEDLGYDVRVSAYEWNVAVDGNTFVHTPTIQSEILLGNYDLEDPFSTDPAHLEAIRKSSVREDEKVGSSGQEVRMALEGSGLPIGNRDAAWTAGVELGRAKAHRSLQFHGTDGMTYGVDDVLGSGGVSFAGEREGAAAFAEVSLPLTSDLDVRAGARGDEYDDVGGMRSWRVGAEYRLSDLITLRSSWSTGNRAPSMLHLYATESQDHPYIECDPGPGTPPRSCTGANPRQVTRVTEGNPDLDPSDADRFAVGGEARRGPMFVGVELYRLSRAGLPGRNNANWALRNLPECMHGSTTDCIERTGSNITIHDSYANVVDTELTGGNLRFGWGALTDWGVVGVRGVWRHVTDATANIGGTEYRLAIPRNATRVGILARRGEVTATWAVSYRDGYRTGRGQFKSWLGHDVTLDWTDPLIQGARLSAGIFNVTDAGLSVNTANPSSVDGPTEANWGRTFFLTLNVQF